MENEPVAVENGESGCENTSNGGINHIDSTPHARGNAANQAGSFHVQWRQRTRRAYPSFDVMRNSAGVLYWTP